MKQCKFCGAIAEDQQVFCVNCGMRLETVEEPQPAAAEVKDGHLWDNTAEISSGGHDGLGTGSVSNPSGSGFETYLKEEKKLYRIKVIIGLAIMVVGFILCAVFPIAGLAAVIGVIYTMFRAIMLLGLILQAKRAQKRIRGCGLWEDVRSGFSSSELFLIDAHNVYCNDRFLYLPGGIILLLEDIRWIYKFESTTRYTGIPIFKQKGVRILTLQKQGMYVALGGTIVNEQAFAALVTYLVRINPKIAVGYSKQNIAYYKDCQKTEGIRG